MSGETNIFDFLHNITGINQEEANAFIYPDLPRLLAEGKEFPSPEKYVEDLIDFLQTADEDSIRKLNVLAFFMRNHNSSILKISSPKDKSPMHDTVSQFQFHPLLLGGLEKNDLRAIQQALQDNEIGQIVKRKLPGFLLEATSKLMQQARFGNTFDPLKSVAEAVKKELDNISDEYTILEEKAQNYPPVVYQVFSYKPYENLGVSFASFAHAREYVQNAREQRGEQGNNDTAEPDFFVAEIQAGNLDELDEAKQAIESNYSSSSEGSSSWVHRNINSIAFFTPGKDEERQYNPDGSNDIARTIKRLDLMIIRLQETNWFWKFIETVTGRSGLTDKKIQALKEIKDEVFIQKSEIEEGAKSLREVLSSKLDQQATPENKTATYKSLLHSQRFGFSQKPTTTDEMVEEMVQGTRPK
jgi:hypothetical protein